MSVLQYNGRKREPCLGSTSTSSSNETNEVEEELGLGGEPMEGRSSTRMSWTTSRTNSPVELGEAHRGELFGLGCWGSLYGVMFGGLVLGDRVRRLRGGLFREQAETVFLLVRRTHRRMGREDEWVGGGELRTEGMLDGLYTGCMSLAGEGPR